MTDTTPLKADQQAADRVLKAAVREAVALIDQAPTEQVCQQGEVVREWRTYDHERRAVESILTAAGRSAELLLRGRSA